MMALFLAHPDLVTLHLHHKVTEVCVVYDTSFTQITVIADYQNVKFNKNPTFLKPCTICQVKKFYSIVIWKFVITSTNAKQIQYLGSK